MALEWSDLDPRTWWGQVKSRASKDFGGLAEEAESAKAKRAELDAQGKAAGGFADVGEAGYGAMTQESAATRERLRQLAEGKDSLAAEQLRQGLQLQNAQQRSFAA